MDHSSYLALLDMLAQVLNSQALFSLSCRPPSSSLSLPRYLLMRGLSLHRSINRSLCFTYTATQNALCSLAPLKKPEECVSHLTAILRQVRGGKSFTARPHLGMALHIPASMVRPCLGAFSHFKNPCNRLKMRRLSRRQT